MPLMLDVTLYKPNMPETKSTNTWKISSIYDITGVIKHT